MLYHYTMGLGAMRTDRVSLLAAVCLLSTSKTWAQTVNELPPVVVTTPSPVQKAIPKPQAVKPRTEPLASDGERIGQRQQPKQAAVPPAQGMVTTTAPSEPDFVAVTVMTPQELLRENAQSLGEALAGKPGVAETGFAPATSRPVIRGLSGFRVTTQENGLATGDVSALSDDHAVPVDPLAAGQIEVVRGPATLRYGSQAIGGVVNATNGRIPEAAPPENGTRIETRGAVSSADAGRAGSMMLEQGVGGFVVHADSFYREAEDYGTPRGKQANSALQTRGQSIGGSYVFKDGFLGLAYSTFDSTYSIPGGEQADNKNHIVLDQSKLSSKGELRVGEYGVEAIRTWFGATWYHHDEVDSLPVTSIGSSYQSRQYEARAEAQHMPAQLSFGELRGAVGAQWTNRRLIGDSADGGPGGLLPLANTQNEAAYIFEELQVSRPLRFQIAGRIESSDVKGTATYFPASFNPVDGDPMESALGKTFVPKSASAGVLYEFPQNVVARLTAQHIERAPDATELFYRGAHDSTATFEIGNPNLATERANTLEIGLKRALGELRFDASAYRTAFQGFIYKRFTGIDCGDTFETCGVENTLRQVVYSQRNAAFTGAELQAEYDIAPLWRGMGGFQGQYDFVRAVFDNGTYAPKIPPHRLGGGVYYYDKALLARVSLLHAFAQDEFGAYDTPTPGYNLLNAEISYTFKTDPLAKFSPDFTVGVRGDNLLNEDIRNAVSYKKDQVLEAGRSVRLFGSVKLN
jgi:iron complex outermembrane recepter protein